jgi:hypothetical protein
MKAIKTTLLIPTFAAIQFFGNISAAAPVVLSLAHYTDRFGPHSVPGLPIGDKVQINAFIDTDDPQGSPTISVGAVQGGTSLTLPPFISPQYQEPPFDNPYQQYFDFDPGLLGSWEIIPADSTGVGPSEFTNAIAEPEYVPLVENIVVGGTPVGASVSWALPNLDGFDVDLVFVRIIEVASGNAVYQTGALPFQTTSLELPVEDLQYGVDYVSRIQLNDYEGDYVENRSNTFSEPFRFALPGDFNTDGAVDAADYVVWRKSFSGDQAMYDAWRANFGSSLGPGSGSAITSAAPLSAPVPEPTALALAALALAPLVVRRKQLHRRARSTPTKGGRKRY